MRKGEKKREREERKREERKREQREKERLLAITDPRSDVSLIASQAYLFLVIAAGISIDATSQKAGIVMYMKER